MVYGISSGALRAAAFAQRHPERVKRLALDAHVWTGEGSPTLAQRKKKLPEYLKTKRRPIDKAFVRSIFERDHPGTADDRTIQAFADYILELDSSIPNGTYIDMCNNLPVVDPTKIVVPTIIMRGEGRRHRRAARSDQVLRAAAEPGQAVRHHAGHRARVIAAEELHDRAAHHARVLHAAGAGVQDVQGLGLTHDATTLATKTTSGFCHFIQLLNCASKVAFAEQFF